MAQFEPPTPESLVERIEAGVELSADQKTKIIKYYSDAMDNAGQGGGRGMMGMGRGGSLPEEVAAILTADQVKKYDAYTLQQSIDRRLNPIDEAVTLTADQKTKVTDVIKKEIDASNKMSAEMMAQGENADFQSMMDDRAALREATDAALAKILTKDQLTKYNAMPRGRGGFGGM
ncbi:hypothetical protein ACFL6K_00655 [Candidatus Latescibacterota bacterium]